MFFLSRWMTIICEQRQRKSLIHLRIFFCPNFHTYFLLQYSIADSRAFHINPQKSKKSYKSKMRMYRNQIIIFSIEHFSKVSFTNLSDKCEKKLKTFVLFQNFEKWREIQIFAWSAKRKLLVSLQIMSKIHFRTNHIHSVGLKSSSKRIYWF